MRVPIQATSDAESETIYRELRSISRSTFDTESLDFGGGTMLFIAAVRYIVLGKLYNIVLSGLLVLVICVVALGDIDNPWIAASLAGSAEDAPDLALTETRYADGTQYGARVAASLGRFDFATFYYSGWDRTPHVGNPTVEVDLMTLAETATASPAYRRQDVYAGSATTTLAGLLLRSETGYKILPAQDGFDAFSTPSGAVSMEKLAPDWIRGWDLYAALQLQTRGDIAESQMTLERLFSRAAIAHVRMQPQQGRWSPRLTALVNPAEGGGLVRPELDLRFIEGDAAVLTLGADLLVAAEGSLYRNFLPLSRATAALSWSY